MGHLLAISMYGGIMVRNKEKVKNYYLVFILMVTVILLYGIYQSYWWFFTILIPLWYVYKSNMTLKQVMLYLCIGAIPLIIYVFVQEYSLIAYLGKWIDQLFHWSLRNHTASYVQSHYDIKTASFINLVMFNIKTDDAWSLYYKMIDLSIVYLIVVSGFHLSVLKNLIKKIFRNRIASNTISITVILIYVYLLNFAVSVDRVFLTLIFAIALRKIMRNRFDLLSLSAMFTIILVPSSVFNLGFCMSYLCTAVIIYIYKLEIQHYLLEKIMINLLAVLVSLPFVLMMNQQISLWVVINSFLFSYLFIFIFIYFLFTFWIYWIAPVQTFIVNAIFFIIEANWMLNVTVKLNALPQYALVIYYAGCYFACDRLYKLKNHL